MHFKVPLGWYLHLAAVLCSLDLFFSVFDSCVVKQAVLKMVYNGFVVVLIFYKKTEIIFWRPDQKSPMWCSFFLFFFWTKFLSRKILCFSHPNCKHILHNNVLFNFFVESNLITFSNVYYFESENIVQFMKYLKEKMLGMTHFLKYLDLRNKQHL